MNRADLSIGIVATAPSPATSGTTLVLQSGQGADMPAVPFKALICPPGQLATRYNSERVLVTNRSDDTLTITRAQGVTSAKTIEAGWLLSNNIFADDFVGSVSVVKKETPSGAVNGSNVTFTTANPYIGGTLQVFVNGLAQSNFITETVPSTGTFTLDEAPLTGDNVRVEYSFTSTSYGNADTVDGYNANATPTANTIPVLNTRAQTGEWWEELGRHTLSTAGTLLTVDNLPAKRHLKLLINISSTGGSTALNIRFNNDSANNYASRISDNGGADATGVSESSATLANAATYATISFDGEIHNNIAGVEKFIVGQRTHGATGASNAPSKAEYVAKWANTANQITRIDVARLTGTGNYAVGAQLIVLGHD